MNSRVRELFVAYLVVLLLLTFLPLDGIDRGQPVDLRLGVFRTINFAFRQGLASHQFIVLIGNIAAFVPLGIFVPLLQGRASLVRVFLIALGLSTAIELGQLAVSIAVGFAYRAADVDDVITNVFGALIGCVAFMLFRWAHGVAVRRRAAG
ncbi:MAG TPA: VanZ family protein [Candidatus Limnocylindrales bacterium]